MVWYVGLGPRCCVVKIWFTASSEVMGLIFVFVRQFGDDRGVKLLVFKSLGPVGSGLQ